MPYRNRQILTLLLGAALVSGPAAAGDGRLAALYPQDGRRAMAGPDFARFPGAGILFCRDAGGVPKRAAAAWLIAGPRVVMLNAHNFRSRRLEVTRAVADCFFQIAGRNHDFEPDSLHLGVAPGASALHITDDWALLSLREPVTAVAAQPVPDAAARLPTGGGTVPVTMVSPAGHENFGSATSLEACAIRQVDRPGEDGIRMARHDCNNGYGGSGSGLFDAAGNLLAMHSASLSMNSRRAYDGEFHYGSALLLEGPLLDALREAAARTR
ncbi:Trypsin-like peptidase domain-containing protein [Methylobacterium sp. ap11]|uniref:trypsin-like peptidase domain-containing protein n=1 Tax=Methylobacterium sp. ap11 TaxID=1761799 RepID=UPI0008AF2B7D|nr:trypsin-like peptidase domain-containing protein [Methylobacterium sp. ap11]SEO57926.1 Trypsin-like peptidase domain-containing protein [Methylobacterium sp. ap11]